MTFKSYNFVKHNTDLAISSKCEIKNVLHILKICKLILFNIT